MTEGAPIVSVVLPVRNGADTIAEQLQALSAQIDAPPFEVLVCDNGSQDATRQVVGRFIGCVPGLRVLDAGDRPGASHARNVGIRHARGDVLAFCDADDVVAGDWVGILAGAVHSGHVVAGWLDLAALNDPQTAAGDGIERELRPLWGYLPGIGSGNVALTRDDAIRIGGFDESYRWGVEDIDFGWRAQQAGLTLSREPATVAVRLRSGVRAAFRQNRNWGRGNIMLQLRYADVLGNTMSFRYSCQLAAVTAFVAPLRLIRERDPRQRREIAAGAGRAIGEFEGHVLLRRPAGLPTPRLLEISDEAGGATR